MRVEAVPEPQGLPEPAALDGADESAPGGPLEKLRRQREQLAEHRTEDFEIPGYTGFFMRAGRLGVDRSREVLNEPDTPSVERNAQLLIEACQALFYRDQDGTDTQLSDGFDDVVAEGLGITINESADIGPARQVVLGIFDGNEHAVVLFAVAVYSWMVTLRAVEDEQALGGSTGTPTSR